MRRQRNEKTDNTFLDNGHLDKIGELKTQIDQLKVRYSPKDIVRKSSVMDTDPQDDRAAA